MIAELIGHYRVIDTLGSGGMGVVYKAIDTRLNRPVALKAIRESGAGSVDAILRLRAEALAAASLDHPYICKIYELLETGTATVVVMEFVEGETLGDILTRRTPALVDTLRYGSEIGEGLANAHARGIVHRDVKPTNVMVTPHNHIKLLDFGIARITAAAAITQSGLTLPGNTPGTPQYMAPEQALGRPVDGRADLFSLGVLLFRCLAGQLPFEGATRDEYVQNMLAGTMRPLEQLAPAAPEPVRQIVKACLEREPQRRPESATVVADTLRRAADALSTGTIPVVVRESPAVPRWAMQVALLGILAVAVIFGTWRWTSRPAEDTTPRSLVPVVTWPSAESDGLISPDGKWLSFISDRDGEPRIFVQALDGGDAVAVALPGPAASHAWSPDGRELASIIRQPNGQFLVVVPAFFGGAPRISVPLDAAFEQPVVVRWISDGVFMDVNRGQRGRSLVRLALPGGGVEEISERWPKPFRFRGVDISPAGEVVVAGMIEGRSDIYTSRLDGSELTPITNDDFVDRDPVWVGQDAVVFESSRGGQMDLWQLSRSTQRATQLTSSLMTETVTGAGADGTVVFAQSENRVNLWQLSVRSGQIKQLTGDALSDFWPSSSADGRRYAFQRARPTPTEGFQFIDARILVTPESSSSSRDTLPIADGFGAKLSPDGNWIAHYQRLPDPKKLRVLLRNLRTGELRTLAEDAVLPMLTPNPPIDWVGQTITWGTAGDLFFLAGADGQRAREIRRARTDRPEMVTIVSASPGAGLRDVHVSTDGTMVGFLLDPKDDSPQASRVTEVHAFDLTQGRDTVVAREKGKRFELLLPGWLPSGSLLLHRAKGPTAGVYELELTELGRDGTRRPVAIISDAFASTLRLDPRGHVYVTRSSGGIHNVHRLSVADGKMRQLTSNDAPGVSFSGIQPLGEEAIVFARDERRRDIWLVKRK